jgi:hypothetical protein
LKPDFTDALIGKAVILGKLGRKDEAKLCADKVLEIKDEGKKEKPIQCTSMNDQIRQQYNDAQKKFKSEFSPNP